ncbi:hypothetical protein [Achromobacter phage Motura]|uniref:Uncharacterized protein n=1 Tax=Achromobacter phage Motura TaxID=2591403 RepID=A0A514CSQ3_9CAUD|nr:hypothetical protein H1O15_gp316 [Achromobacter phage Motura]QDH83490.1 hypothetical protein [Achromobacter phage Motura]
MARYQSKLTLAGTKLIIAGLQLKIKQEPKKKVDLQISEKTMKQIVDVPEGKLRRQLLKMFKQSVAMYRPKHQGIIVEIRHDHVRVAEVITEAAREALLSMEWKGKRQSTDTAEHCRIADAMDTIKAYNLYPELKCGCCGKVADKRSLLAFNGICGRQACRAN